MVSSACYRADGTQVGIEGRVGRLCWFFIVVVILFGFVFYLNFGECI